MAYGCTYGRPYGDPTCPTVDPTIRGSEPQCKQDTYFLGKGSGVWADLAVDRSDQGTNLTVGTDCIYTTSFARFDRPNRHEITFQLLLNDTNSGVLYNTGGSGFGLSVDAGVVSVLAGEAVIAEHTIENITSTDAQFVISWNVEPALQSAFECRSELHVLNLTEGTVELFFAEFDEPASPSGEVVFGAAANDGTNAYDNTIYLIRYGARFHTSVETSEDFAGLSEAPTTELVFEPELLDMADDCGVWEEGEFHGPAMAWASAHHRGMLRRVMSPLVNQYYHNPAELDIDSADSPFWKYFGTVGYGLMYLHRVPIARTANRLYVRVFLETSTTGGTLSYEIRCYSMTKLPGVSGDFVGPGDPPEPARKAYVSATINRNDSTGGQWSELGFLAPQYTRDGMTYLALALVGFDSAGHAQSAWIHGWQVIPCQLDVGDGGFGPGDLDL